jgi:hypothetical protein
MTERKARATADPYGMTNKKRKGKAAGSEELAAFGVEGGLEEEGG